MKPSQLEMGRCQDFNIDTILSKYRDIDLAFFLSQKAQLFGPTNCTRVPVAISYTGWTKKVSPATFVDSLTVCANFCIKFYTTVKLEMENVLDEIA